MKISNISSSYSIYYIDFVDAIYLYCLTKLIIFYNYLIIKYLLISTYDIIFI